MVFAGENRQRNNGNIMGLPPDGRENPDGISHIEVPVHCKIALTIPEAAAYSNIGQNRISKMLRTPNCPFALFVGNKKLVKRREFERFVEGRLFL